jgi:hypothetical protein
MSVPSAILWLKFTSIILMIAFGILFAIAAFPPTSGFATLFVDSLIWPIDGAQSLAGTETRILLAIGGGITAGWGMLVWQVADKVMPTQPEAARSILLSSLLTWFVIDGICSVLAGVPLNALVNVGFLAPLLWPVWRMNPRGVVAS